MTLLRHSKKTRALSALILLSSLPGCSMLYQDGSIHKTRHFNIPIYNSASEQPPYTHVAGTPIPDLGWSRERLSECETWYPGDNGCTRKKAENNTYLAPETATAAPETAPSPVRHHRRKTYHGS